MTVHIFYIDFLKKKKFICPMSLHNFHIPVMGSGHTIDTPIRVAHFGISSVVSLVDDLLLEPIRKHYCQKYNFNFQSIPRNVEDGRAKRIRAYLDMMDDIIQINFKRVQEESFILGSDKTKYFELLPNACSLKKQYLNFLSLSDEEAKEKEEKELTQKMEIGRIDVNIMVKLDRVNYNRQGEVLSNEYTDAKAALRGYANSKLHSCIIFSAGINQTLYTYMSSFKDFYRDANGYIKKKIILKVSDYRSTIIQGKFLARKGLEVYEFRIESGLNCGGHAFASNGYLLPQLLQEFSNNRENLSANLIPTVKSVYEKKELEYKGKDTKPRLTVQGGIGTYGESQRLFEKYGMDATGWATPFLLVPEATPIDDSTRNLLKNATAKDTYLSDVSPLGVVFNNVRNTGSELWTRGRVEKGTPGSPCPKGFLVSNSEFTEKDICTASREYQKQKLEQIEHSDMTQEESSEAKENVYVKACICDHLGNGALISLGLVSESKAPQSICPGPNVAWFDRYYSLKEMVDHIYGQGNNLISDERPHMFEKEIEMYINYYRKQVKLIRSEKDVKRLLDYKSNLLEGIEMCLNISKEKPYPNENLKSLAESISQFIVEVESIAEGCQVTA